jgi:anaerobic ribonucleoside-triphosphate reductase activating protein
VNLRLAGIQEESIVDGPGVRLVIFFQGCSHCCPGCHNPETHDPLGGSLISLEQVISLIDSRSGLSGVTISGGEPFEQAESAAALAAAVRKRGLDVVVYSGFTFEELFSRSRSDHNLLRVLQSGWLLIDGPFVTAEQDLTLPYRGSRNQRLVDLPRSLEEGRAIQWPPEIIPGRVVV